MTSRTRLVAGVTLMAALTGAVAEESPPARSSAGDTIREVMYFGAGGPVRLRFRCVIDGRSTETAWTEAVKGLFDYRDRDHNGVLDPAEQAPFLAPRSSRRTDVQVEGNVPGLQLNLPPKSTRVEFATFATAVEDAGYGPVERAYFGPAPESKRASEVLFRQLDRDGDGKLSREEIMGARERLAPFDLNEDEWISLAELLDRNVPTQNRFPAPQRASQSSDSSPDVVMLSPGPAAAAKQLLAARMTKRGAGPQRGDLGMDGATFAALDKNGDGKLDVAELEAWLSKPADAEFMHGFDIASRRGRVALGPAASAGTARLSTGIVANGGIEVAGAGVRWRFDQPAPLSDGHEVVRWQTFSIQKRIKALADAKGMVERKVLAGQADLLAFFEFAHRKNAAALEEAEWEEALRVLAPMASCRVRLQFVDHGTGLFELLDANGDGRLSSREFVDAVAVLKPFADKLGNVGPGDLPRRFSVNAELGSIPPAPLAASVEERMRGTPTNSSKKPGSKPLPTWFSMMDRNGDGDVSLREFTGPIELFQKLDRNGDALISVEEVRRSDALDWLR